MESLRLPANNISSIKLYVKTLRRMSACRRLSTLQPDEFADEFDVSGKRDYRLFVHPSAYVENNSEADWLLSMGLSIPVTHDYETRFSTASLDAIGRCGVWYETTYPDCVVYSEVTVAGSRFAKFIEGGGMIMYRGGTVDVNGYQRAQNTRSMFGYTTQYKNTCCVIAINASLRAHMDSLPACELDGFFKWVNISTSAKVLSRLVNKLFPMAIQSGRLEWIDNKIVFGAIKTKEVIKVAAIITDKQIASQLATIAKKYQCDAAIVFDEVAARDHAGDYASV